MKQGIYALLGVHAPFDPHFSLVTSPVMPPLALAALRLALAAYGTVFVLFRLIYEGVRYHSDGSFFSYFTSLSYIGLLSYFWASGVQTLSYARSLRARAHPHYALQSWPRPLQFLHLLLQSTVLTFPIIVTAVFWSLLASPDTLSTRYAAWTNISEHALNTAFAGLEILLSNAAPSPPRRPRSGVAMPWAHLPFLVALLACYLGVAYITSATQHFYTYAFLDPHTQHAKLAAYIVGIAAAEAVLFVLVRYAMMLRAHLVARRTAAERGVAYVHSPSDAAVDAKTQGGPTKEELDDWQEVSRPSSGERGVAV